MPSCWECRGGLIYRGAPQAGTTLCLIQTSAVTLGTASVLGRDGWLHSLRTCTPHPQLSSLGGVGGRGRLRARMPKPASPPVFWVPLHPAPGAINSTLNEMSVSGIPAAHPSGTLAHCVGWFGGQNNNSKH